MSRVLRVSHAAAVVVVAFAGIACAGGNGDDKAAATGTAPAERKKGEGTASRRAIDAAAQTRAESMVLRLGDLPDGWRGSPSEDDDQGDEKFRRCVGSDYSGFTIIGQSASDEFSMGENTSVSSESSVFVSEADARGSLEEFARGMRSSTVEDCWSRFIREAIQGEDYEVGEIDVGELSFSSPANVDEARAWEVAIPLEPTSDKGLRVTAYLDVVHLRAGDVLASVATEDVLSPFDAELRTDLVKKVAGRMADPSDY